jgi:hypothetical protein
LQEAPPPAPPSEPCSERILHGSFLGSPLLDFGSSLLGAKWALPATLDAIDEITLS